MTAATVLADINRLANINNLEPPVSNSQVINSSICEDQIVEEKAVEEKVFLKKEKKEKDPIKVLESLKEKTEKRLKAGEISKEETERIKARIDERIAEIREFEKLPLEEKKKILISSLEQRLEKKVRENKLSQEKADEILQKKREEIEAWDGKSYPEFVKRYFFRKQRFNPNNSNTN